METPNRSWPKQAEDKEDEVYEKNQVEVQVQKKRRTKCKLKCVHI